MLANSAFLFDCENSVHPSDSISQLSFGLSAASSGTRERLIELKFKRTKLRAERELAEARRAESEAEARRAKAFAEAEAQRTQAYARELETMAQLLRNEEARLVFI